MNVLVACEESQRVCTAFREKGHNAFSCDILQCSGGHPEWHIMQDVIPLLDGRCRFSTVDGTEHYIAGRWDLIIAHPPCTYLTAIVEKDRDMVRWVHKKTGEKKSCSKWYNTNTNRHSRHRSKTFAGVAKAMAEQWGGECND